ncbi:MAG: type II toxin-antitoxin system RelE/ParE family toxin [Bryobacteraceae bacterium]
MRVTDMPVQCSRSCTSISIYVYCYNLRMKSVQWVGTSRKDVQSFPERVRRVVGHALYAAQNSEVDSAAKPLRGFGSAKVMEIVADHDSGTYRSVYTVQFREIVYVLHAFQKKSKQGISTPRRDLELIRSRLSDAARDYKRRLDQE